MDIEEKYENTVGPYRETKSAQENSGFFMSAYWYGFELTGNPLIDEILQAVAIAGKNFHSTEEWNETRTGRLSPAESIQHAANRAAKTLMQISENKNEQRDAIKK